jgi:hypothetical protein
MVSTCISLNTRVSPAPITEFATVINAIAANDKINAKNNLIGPSIASADWQPQDVWNTGFIQAYAQNLLYLSVERQASLV